MGKTLRSLTFFAAATVSAVALGAGTAGAQTQEQMDRIKAWNPQIREFQKPGEIQKAGEIQVPRGIQAIRVINERCERRLAVGSDALFAFDRWDLSPEAEETLLAVVPEIQKAGKHPVSIEGHTDAKGSETYNQTLSEKRSAEVKQWLVAKGALPAGTSSVGYGEAKPVAPNQKADGSDDPEGRQKNRRVEVVIDTCK